MLLNETLLKKIKFKIKKITKQGSKYIKDL